MKRFFLFLAASALACLVLLAIVAGNLMSIGSFVASADPLWVLTLAALALALCSFLAGLITGDYSWVDRLWSTAPVAFVWFYAWRGGFSLALVVAAVLISIWGFRLTLNFARKGGYSGEEDYRWGVLRLRITNKFAWQAFNLGFISCYQIGLFLLFTLPTRILWEMTQTPIPLGQSSWGLSLGFILSMIALAGFIIYEGIADRQQWDYQATKKAANQGLAVTGQRYAEDVSQGFLSSGLFAHSRHPNYFGEIAVWWALYFAAAFASGQLLNLTLIGPVMLTLLFIGSTNFTEAITGAKYPQYKDYCRRTSPIIPWFHGTAGDETINNESTSG